MNILNSAENRYDKTPVDYKSSTYKVLKKCENRRYDEAINHCQKLGRRKADSLSRILFELDTCLQKEDWKQMAELIILGLDAGHYFSQQSDSATAFLNVCSQKMFNYWFSHLKLIFFSTH